MRYAIIDKATDSTQKYCIVCEKIEILTYEKRLQTVQEMDSKKTERNSKKICTIVKKAGIAEASFHNIRLTPSRKNSLYRY
ncbi:MAG: hypothetical protein QRY74_03465 [Chlamydia sp.]